MLNRETSNRTVKNSLVILGLALLGPLLWACAGEADTGSITPDELLGRLGTDEAPFLLDVRSPREYESGHIPGAYNLENGEVQSRLAELTEMKEREIVVYCEGGPRARGVEAFLRENGFTNVRHLDGDMGQWRADNHPMELGSAVPAGAGVGTS
jgi:rhodanese-related sulfurtransferase